jgi:hypothetical protein
VIDRDGRANITKPPPWFIRDSESRPPNWSEGQSREVQVIDVKNRVHGPLSTTDRRLADRSLVPNAQRQS